MREPDGKLAAMRRVFSVSYTRRLCIFSALHPLLTTRMLYVDVKNDHQFKRNSPTYLPAA